MKHRRIAKFKSDSGMARWFETHDTADYWDEFKEVEPIELDPQERRRIRREARRKRLVTLRLAPEQIAAARAVARRKGIPYLTQLRLWIHLGMANERGRSA